MSNYGRFFSRGLSVISVFLLALVLTACDGVENEGGSKAVAENSQASLEVTSDIVSETSSAASGETAPVNTEAAVNPVVKMDTNKGTVIFELFADKAPETVKNFLRYVNEGAYNNTIFHRVVKDTVNQAGEYDFDQKKIAINFPPIKNEADNGLKNKRGTIAMLRSVDPDSATRQFFINVSDNAAFDHKEKTPAGWGFCVFGKVTEGMEVMDRISLVKTTAFGEFDKYAPMYPVNIRSVTVIKQ